MGKKRMNQKQKLIAYVLNTDADLNRNKNITQREIADILWYTQTTIAQNNKDTNNQITKNQFQKELSENKAEIPQMKGIEVLNLPSDMDSEYKHKP